MWARRSDPTPATSCHKNGQTTCAVRAEGQLSTTQLSATFGLCASISSWPKRSTPWNAEHINHLPAEVRGAVLAMCQKPPSAGHYFATYFHARINLHFEHFHNKKYH